MFSFVSKVLIKFDVIGRQHPRSMHEKTRDSVEKNVGGGRSHQHDKNGEDGSVWPVGARRIAAAFRRRLLRAL